MICEILCFLSLLISFYALSKRELEVKVIDVKLKKEREKERKRYVLIQVIAEDPSKVNEECLDRIIKDSVKDLYGLIGLSLSKPKVVYLDPATKMVIVRTTIQGVKILASSLLKKDEGCRTKLRLIPLRAFGTLASARERIPKFTKSLEHSQ